MDNTCEKSSRSPIVNINEGKLERPGNGIADFQYKYNNNPVILQIHNNTDYLEAVLESSETSPQVIFNKGNCSLNSIKIYRPSVHQFNSSTVDGEVIIEYQQQQSIMGNKKLYVCIPFVQKGSVSPELSEIIINGYALGKADSARSSIAMQRLLPKYGMDNPYYYYGNSPEICGEGCCSTGGKNNDVIILG